MMGNETNPRKELEECEETYGPIYNITLEEVRTQLVVAPERNKNGKKYRWNDIWGRVFVNVVSLKYFFFFPGLSRHLGSPV